MKLIYQLIIACAVLLTFSNSQAELFRNAYLSFELPPNWKCSIEGTEWVCINKFNARAKEAIIILTAKEAGPNDSLANFKAHLKQKKTIKTKSGKNLRSHVYNVKDIKINDHVWVDSLQINSEVSDYYTRYIATKKNKIAVLVTFSAHKAHYTKYSQDFFKAIQSLRVIPPKLAGKGLPMAGNRQGPIGNPTPSPIFPGGLEEELPEEDTGGLSDTQINIAAIALLLAAIGAYLLKKQKS